MDPNLRIPAPAVSCHPPRSSKPYDKVNPRVVLNPVGRTSQCVAKCCIYAAQSVVHMHVYVRGPGFHLLIDGSIPVVFLRTAPLENFPAPVGL